MSIKRQATTELNHENWDQEEPEDKDDGGALRIASRDILEKRVIRTAKRRTQVSGDETKKSAFSGFSGFNKTQPSSFDFLAKLTNGSPNNTTTKTESPVTFGLTNTKPVNPPASGFFSTSGLPQPPKISTEVSNESPFVSTSAKPSPLQSVFKASTVEQKTNNPFNIQTSTSAFASFAPKTTESTTTSLVGSNIFGSNVTSNVTNSPFTANTTSISSPFSTNTTNTSSPFATKTTSISSPFSTNTTTISSPFATNTTNTSSPFATKTTSISSPFTTNTTTASPFATNTTSTSSPFKMPATVASKNLDVEKTKKDNDEAKQKFYIELKTLNVCLSDCIKSHVDKTPLCILTPIFKDYEKYLSEIQNEYEKSKKESNAKPDVETNAANNSVPGFTHDSPKSVFSSNILSSGDKPPNFSFGITTTAPANPLATPPTASSSIFGSGQTTSTNTSINGTPFSFGIGKPFSFNTNVKQNEEQSKQVNEEEDDQPPKVEYTPVVEENSIYDKKCKVFVKKDGNFVEKGVGTLYVKKIKDSEKHQLLVRANTSLGNILLNFILSSSIPTQRMGKNNVMVVCIPTPDSQPPPVPVLIRVKTSEEADDLLSTLEKYKV